MLLPTTVFFTGASILIIEIVATRALSPYFGNTIFTVSSVITIILAALSIGYAAGGRIADRHPNIEWFFTFIAAGGIALLLCYGLSIPLLPLISRSSSLMTGPLVASIAFFFIPCLILGTLSPYAIVIQKTMNEIHGVGFTAGRIFFWSTLGSIAGSLATGFLLIPTLGIKTIMISNGIALCLVGCLPLFFLQKNKRRVLILATACILSVIASLVFLRSVSAAPTVYDRDGIYEHISIIDEQLDGRPVRKLKQDHTDSGARFLDTTDPFDVPYAYARYAEAYQLVREDAARVLTIGGGTYTVANMYLSRFPNADIEAVEIEPSLAELAKKYFGLMDSDRLHLVTEDGRRYLEQSKGAYDIIFSDVYQSFISIPSHMTTISFFHTAKSKLSPNGIFIANVIGDLSRRTPSVLFSEIRTMQQAFPNMMVFAVEDVRGGPQNFILVGFNRNEPVNVREIAADPSQSEFLRSLAAKAVVLERFNLDSYPILTDDYAPTEFITARTIQRLESRSAGPDGNEILAIMKQQMQYGNRSAGTEGNIRIRSMIESELNAQSQDMNGLTLFTVSTSSHALSAHFHPEQTNRIAIAARYDFTGQGAGSGTALLLHLISLFSHIQPPASLGIDVIFFESGDRAVEEVLNELTDNARVLFIEGICGKEVVFDGELKKRMYARKPSEEIRRCTDDSLRKTALAIERLILE